MNVKLIMFHEDGRRREFPLPPGPTTIGRKQDCTIRIPLAVVSRLHAEIVVEEDAAVLRDLGASNGTFLNNRKIVEEHLKPGDQIMVGPVVLTVQIDGQPADEEIIQVRCRASAGQAMSPGSANVGTSKHVSMSDEDMDPIAALEALASSADQTAISPEEDETPL